MMIESNYQINVSKNGIHEYLIELGAISNKEAIEKFRNILIMHQLLSDDYECDLTYVECVGHPLTGKGEH